MTQQVPTVDTVVARYIELREEVSAMSARHAAEMDPLRDKMSKIESWLLAKMTADGVDSYKTPHGTPYKATRTSVTMEDRSQFMEFVLRPAAEAIDRLVRQFGLARPDFANEVRAAIFQFANWGIVDLRAGKKGIEEQVEATGQLPPGIARSQVVTVNIRKA